MAIKFKLGQTVATPAALALLEKHNVDASKFLTRHANGDWGDICEEDKQQNDEGIEGGRLHSSYNIGNEKLWIITEYDRSASTILLPSDY